MTSMGRDVEALLDEMRRNIAGARFDDACKVATYYFGKPRNRGSSHFIWKMPWAGDPRVNLQEGSGGRAKPYQVRQLLAAVERLIAETKP